MASALVFSGVSWAGSCEIHFNRTACPGKEDISYKKCDGKKECSEIEDADNLAACQALASTACENKRLSITKSKIITAKFDGKDIKDKAGNADFCVAYPDRSKEFDHCDSK